MTTRTREALLAQLDTLFPDNTLGEITPTILRQQQTDVIDSMVALLSNNATRSVVLAGNHTANQGPTATDVAHQVLFGLGNSLFPEFTIGIDGSITCNVSGSYGFNMHLNYGRSSSVQSADMFVRILINGVQLGGSGENRFNSADSRLTKSASFEFGLVATDVMTVEIIRDSVGNNDGGLFASSITAGWNDVPSASIVGYRHSFGDI